MTFAYRAIRYLDSIENFILKPRLGNCIDDITHLVINLRTCVYF